MDFFAAQDQARRRTTRLVVLFALAVAGTIAAGYVATVFLLAYLGPGAPASHGSGYAGFAAWQPDVLAWVALGTIAIVGLSSLAKWSRLRAGGPAVARMLGARPVNGRTTDLRERQLLNVVEEMAIASGTPMPAVFVLPEETAINAFAAGLTPSDAAVAVTRGALDHLTRDELQGVIGHEFSHILNGDMRLNLRLTSVVFGILVIALSGQTLLRSLRFARVSGGRGRKGNAGAILLALLAIGAALMLIGYVGYFFGRLIQAAVSRQREYLADAAAVQFTRHPAGLAGALKKIGGLARGSRLENPRAAQFNHALFAQNFGRSLTGWFATHPPLPERIRALDPHFQGTLTAPPARPAAQPAGPRARPPAPAAAAAGGQVAGVAPAALVASVGAPSPEHVIRARALLQALPPELPAAAADPSSAPALLYALLLDREPAVRQRQLTLLEQHDRARRAEVEALDVTPVPAEGRLPLVQLAVQGLRGLEPAGTDRLLETLDALVHADERVTPLEYAMQKMVSHHLRLARHPQLAAEQIFSFTAVADELAVVLSVLAHAGGADPARLDRALAAGNAALRMLDQPLPLLPPQAVTLDRLDAALDRLAQTSLPIKKRLIQAAAEVVGADGRVRPAEAELLRAIASALDCPIPPVVGASTHEV